MTEPRRNPVMPEALRSVASAVQVVRSTLVAQARLDAASGRFLAGALAGAVGMIVARVLGMPPAGAWWFLLGAPAGAAAGWFFGKVTVGDAYAIAKRIDDDLSLKDRLAGGYDLLRRFREDGVLPSTPFVSLILAQAAEAADAARHSYRVRLRLPRGVVAGALCLAAAGAASLWVVPGREEPVREITQEEREQVRALDEFVKTIEAMEGLTEEEKQASLEALESIRIDKDELAKMSRADIIRRIKEANARIRLPAGAEGGAVRRALEDKMRAIAEMKQVEEQLAEIEAINRRDAAIDLGDGRTAEAVNIRLESSDLHLDEAIVEAARRPGEAEQDYQRRISAAEARSRAEREKIRKFLALNVGAEMPESDQRKLAALLANDAEFQGKVLEAIRDPNSKQYDAMREIYRRQLEREFDRENIPRGLRQQLSTYLGR